MKKTEAISDKPKYKCDFCNREFALERTVVNHICEKKQRWQAKDTAGNRIGFYSWLQFFDKTPTGIKNKNRTYEDFIKSPYYTAFVKFGSYCTDVNVINPSKYMDWLLHDQIKIDKWASDTMYNKFLCHYLRLEDAFDAIHRTVKYCIEMAEEADILPQDLLRYGNANKICYAITLGKISPWMLYSCDSGIRFLETLNPEHVKMIEDYINPEQWALKFHREKDISDQVKDLLKQAGY